MAESTRSPLVDTLPEVFRSAVSQSPPLAALLAAAQEMHAPVIGTLDTLERVVDPFRSPERFVGHLASWVDLAWLTVPDAAVTSRSGLGAGSAALRDLIAESAGLSARRGTPGGLIRFLSLATRVEGYAVEDVPGAFHLRVHVPAQAASQLPAIERIVRVLKPAHVTAELVLEPAPAAVSDSEAAQETPIGPVPVEVQP